MRKYKLLATVVVFLLLVSLAGCGSNSGDANQNDAPKPTSAESPSKDAYHEDDVIIKTDDYSNGTTQVALQDIKFQVPQSWRIVKGDGETTYYYPESENVPLMSVSFAKIEGEFSILEDNNLSDFVEGLKNTYSNFNLLKKDIYSNSSDLKLGYAEFSGTISGYELENYLFVFDCQDGIIAFLFGDNQNSNKDYSSDLLNVINSVEREIDLSKGDIGNFYVSIGECTFTNDYDGNKAIVINYDFTNNSDETVVPLWKTSCRAFQDGIELDSAFIFDGSVYDAGIEQKNIRPGVTLTGCQKAYVLISDSPIEFEMGPIWGDPILQKTFTIN